MTLIPNSAISGVVSHVSTQAHAAALVRQMQAARHAAGVDGMEDEAIAPTGDETGGNGGGYFGNQQKDSVEIAGIETPKEGDENEAAGVEHLDISA